jgi:ABC-type glycerol-3-phosphate transport system permease component
MVSTAFKPHAYVLETPPRLIPEAPTLDNFVDAWTGQDFGRYFLNSLIVALGSTAIAVTLGSMLAFAFARYSFPGRRVLFAALLLTMMVPGMVLLIPQFVLAKNLGLLNSLQGLVVVYATMNLGLNTFLLRGFFSAMPQEIFDAAEVDGAGVWSSFWRVGVPLARPGIATVTLFSFLAAWDEFTWAIVSLSDRELYTLPIAVRSLQRAQATEWGLVFAASLIALAPVLLLFVALQKQFVSGAFVGATKG